MNVRSDGFLKYVEAQRASSFLLKKKDSVKPIFDSPHLTVSPGRLTALSVWMYMFSGAQCTHHCGDSMCRSAYVLLPQTKQFWCCISHPNAHCVEIANRSTLFDWNCLYSCCVTTLDVNFPFRHFRMHCTLDILVPIMCTSFYVPLLWSCATWTTTKEVGLLVLQDLLDLCLCIWYIMSIPSISNLSIVSAVIVLEVQFEIYATSVLVPRILFQISSTIWKLFLHCLNDNWSSTLAVLPFSEVALV
jgi:hypothetical protein